MRFILLTIGFGVAATAALAQAPSHATKLDDCRAAAQAAGDNPTAFKCKWPALVKGAPGGALTGKFSGLARGSNSAMTIIEGGGGPALVAIQSADKTSRQTCTLKATASRGSDDVLVAAPLAAPGCKVRIVSAGRNIVRVTSSSGCAALCGARARFDGNYRLDR